MKKAVSLILALIVMLGMFSFAGCTDNDTTVPESESVAGFGFETENPVALIEVENFGKIYVELYYDKAPNTVKNFISLANSGFYDGLTFHRIINSFMIQGGCPEGTGTGDPGYSIFGEFDVNGFENDIAHDRGVISMARNGYSYDSAGSQFFIVHQNSPHLDGQYAAFGMVIDGMDVVDEIAGVDTGYNDKPVDDVVIKSITVDTNGKTYGEPEKM